MNGRLSKQNMWGNTMVLKTGPDRPVQPGTGVQSGPVSWKNRKIRKMGQKPETASSTIKTANRSGWTGFGPVPLITKLHRFGLTPVTPLPHAGDPSASRRLPPLPHSGDSLSLVPSRHWTHAVSSLVPSPNRNQRSPHRTRGFSHFPALHRCRLPLPRRLPSTPLPPVGFSPPRLSFFLSLSHWIWVSLC